VHVCLRAQVVLEAALQLEPAWHASQSAKHGKGADGKDLSQQAKGELGLNYLWVLCPAGCTSGRVGDSAPGD